MNFNEKTIIFPSYHNRLPLFWKYRSATMVVDKNTGRPDKWNGKKAPFSVI